MNWKEELFCFFTLPVALLINRPLEKWWRKGYFEKLPYRPRLLHWVIAAWGGFFWLPCDICGKNYGGHEPHGSLYHSAFGGKSVCRNCKEEAERRNEENKELFDRQMSEHYSVMIEKVYGRR